MTLQTDRCVSYFYLNHSNNESQFWYNNRIFYLNFPTATGSNC